MIAKRVLMLMTAAMSGLLTACASTPLSSSYLIGDRYFKTPIDTQPVIILGVDDWDTTLRRILVEPGERTIRVQALPVPGAPQQTASLKLDVKPCFTYYIVAVRANPITPDFTPRVDYAEPLAGCQSSAQRS